ncbi:membrane protein [Sulfurifustis variabilis]|uniref:Probable membrane transporter protein n=1 Tax=Sulfurifustis variabilis TaxID=1675686 RepID=A0A1B4V1L2_9GAMM|nr:sulfite exporter TauE/SafE family protein [Sulfurifustis variabilis]BAU47386.1 membrane protein [Sulfurifustis variabilis]
MVAKLLVYAPLLFACGALAGLSAGLLGVGGGIIVVPFLYHVYTALGLGTELAMPLAVGTSLATIVLTSGVAARGHHRRGTVDWPMVRGWLPPVMLGVALGAGYSFVTSGASLKTLFGMLLAVTALHMFVATFRPVSVGRELPGRRMQSALGVAVGSLASVLGIGGGTLMVPLLNLYHYQIHRAVATGSVFGVVISLPATFAYVAGGWGETALPAGSTGYVDWIAFALLVPASILFVPLGVRLAYRLDVTLLKRVFALFLIAVGLEMALG